MTIQINTDKTISGSEKHSAVFTSMLEDELSRFSESVTRVEMHLSDENGKKAGQDDIRCLLEARLQGRLPIAVTNFANTTEEALKGAIDKLKTSLDRALSRNCHN